MTSIIEVDKWVVSKYNLDGSLCEEFAYDSKELAEAVSDHLRNDSKDFIINLSCRKAKLLQE